MTNFIPKIQKMNKYKKKHDKRNKTSFVIQFKSNEIVSQNDDPKLKNICSQILDWDIDFELVEFI